MGSEKHTADVVLPVPELQYHGEWRNHRLKHESDCLLTGISIKICIHGNNTQRINITKHISPQVINAIQCTV
jgi:hypothetical protein